MHQKFRTSRFDLYALLALNKQQGQPPYSRYPNVGAVVELTAVWRAKRTIP